MQSITLIALDELNVIEDGKGLSREEGFCD
jgi:hypothetical protein